MITTVARWFAAILAYYDAEVAAYRRAATSDVAVLQTAINGRVLLDAREAELLPDTRARIQERWRAAQEARDAKRVVRMRKTVNG